MRRDSGNGTSTGNNDINRIGVLVQAALVKAGIDPDKAAGYSLFCMEVYRYIQQRPELAAALKATKDTKDLYDGVSKVVKAELYLAKSVNRDLTAVKSYSASGSAAVFKVMIDHFESYARGHGIELNECSMAVVKVSLDIATAGAGAVSAVTGFGLVLAAYGIISTGKDGYALGQMCFMGR